MRSLSVEWQHMTQSTSMRQVKPRYNNSQQPGEVASVIGKH